mmetsp:Transcript_2160/g.6405  ORF Transcript_2160/g.6405 Transcript_2160/m.6405 type:complete len:452 (+) Transcript_2160:634-1989(+)
MLPGRHDALRFRRGQRLLLRAAVQRGVGLQFRRGRLLSLPRQSGRPRQLRVREHAGVVLQRRPSSSQVENSRHLSRREDCDDVAVGLGRDGGSVRGVRRRRDLAGRILPDGRAHVGGADSDEGAHAGRDRDADAGTDRGRRRHVLLLEPLRRRLLRLQEPRGSGQLVRSLEGPLRTLRRQVVPRRRSSEAVAGPRARADALVRHHQLRRQGRGGLHDLREEQGRRLRRRRLRSDGGESDVDRRRPRRAPRRPRRLDAHVLLPARSRVRPARDRAHEHARQLQRRPHLRRRRRQQGLGRPEARLRLHHLRPSPVLRRPPRRLRQVRRVHAPRLRQPVQRPRPRPRRHLVRRRLLLRQYGRALRRTHRPLRLHRRRRPLLFSGFLRQGRRRLLRTRLRPVFLREDRGLLRRMRRRLLRGLLLLLARRRSPFVHATPPKDFICALSHSLLRRAR